MGFVAVVSILRYCHESVVFCSHTIEFRPVLVCSVAMFCVVGCGHFEVEYDCEVATPILELRCRVCIDRSQFREVGP